MKTRWAIWFPRTGKYLSGASGNIQWLYDRTKAEEHARAIGGEVIDADVLRFKTWEDVSDADKRGGSDDDQR